MLIIGNHGTNKDNVPSIKKNGFYSSKGLHHWCGEGVYFFIQGINENSIDFLAEQWAKDQAYDKTNKTFKYKEYAVIEAFVHSNEERILDLRSEENLIKVNEVRKILEKMCSSKGYKMNDYRIWEYMKNKFDIDIVIHNVYIKFGKNRRQNIESFIPNCTIMSVYKENLIDNNI